MAYAYRIQPGHSIEALEIPPDGLALECGATLLVGREDDRFAGCALPRIAEIVSRIAPFATCWCSPDFLARQGDLYFEQGAAFWEYHTAIISSALPPMQAIGTAYHESGHLIEANVSKDFHDLWTRFTTAGSWGDDYLDRDMERCARLFEHFALFMDHSGTAALTPGSPAALLHPIYTGQVGRGVVASRSDLARRQARTGWKRVLNLAA